MTLPHLCRFPVRDISWHGSFLRKPRSCSIFIGSSPSPSVTIPISSFPIRLTFQLSLRARLTLIGSPFHIIKKPWGSGHKDSHSCFPLPHANILNPESSRSSHDDPSSLYRTLCYPPEKFPAKFPSPKHEIRRASSVPCIFGAISLDRCSFTSSFFDGCFQAYDPVVLEK